MAHGWNWERAGRLASLLGSIKIASRGGQNHHVSRDAVAARYAEHFGEPLF
jgi:adenosine kinase